MHVTDPGARASDLSWEQRAWAAVHVHWPAALTLESALPDPPRQSVIQVAVDVRRTVTPVAGVRAHRTQDWAARLQPRAAPPRIAIVHAAIDVAGQRLADGDVPGAFRVLAKRDLDAAAIEGSVTLRLTYGQVFGTPCRTAVRVAAVLTRRGWTGTLTRCPSCPPSTSS